MSDPIQAAEDVLESYAVRDATGKLVALKSGVPITSIWSALSTLLTHARTLETELARKTAVADAYWEIIESYKAENAALSHRPAGDVGNLVERLRDVADIVMEACEYDDLLVVQQRLVEIADARAALTAFVRR